MRYLQNHCWCSNSNWDDGVYSCSYIISIGGFNTKEDDDDLNTILLSKEDSEYYVDMEEHESFMARMKAAGYELGDTFLPHKKYAPTLKNNVIDWLNNNIKDRNLPIGDTESTKGWCIGNVAYRSNENMGISLFFHRHKDAMEFVKTFSRYKKPTSYINYFKDIRKKLNLTTLKYDI